MKFGENMTPHAPSPIIIKQTDETIGWLECRIPEIRTEMASARGEGVASLQVELLNAEENLQGWRKYRESLVA